MKKIELTQGKEALVDDDYFNILSKWKWYYDGGYAKRKKCLPNKILKTIWMHREIMKTPQGLCTDHIDGNGLNNQKINLRICTNDQNQRNSKKQVNNTSGFKGVIVNKTTKKFQAQIRSNSRKIHLGYFNTAKEAAKAYNIAAKKLHGEFASLNNIPD